jgi:cutinase
LTYGARADEGVDFLTQQINGAQAKLKARKAKREAEAKAKDIVKGLKEKMIAKKGVKIVA